MDRIGARHLGRTDQGLEIKVALSSRRRANLNRLIGLAHMQGESIRIGIDGDRGDTQALTCAHDAAGNLAPIGDQQLGDLHRGLFHPAWLALFQEGGEALTALSAGASGGNPLGSIVGQGLVDWLAHHVMDQLLGIGHGARGGVEHQL